MIARSTFSRGIRSSIATRPRHSRIADENLAAQLFSHTITIAAEWSDPQVTFDLVEGVDDAVDQVPGTSLDVIANYTAFQQIRVALGRAE